MNFCDMKCRHAKFPEEGAVDGAGSCRTFVAVYCARKKAYFHKNMPCPEKEEGERRTPAKGLPLLLLLSLSLLVGACCDLEITTGSLPDAVRGVPYATSLDSDCGGDLWFLSQGTLPPGVALYGDGELSGTPTAVGRYDFTVGLEDFSGEVVFKGLSLEVLGPGR